MSDLGKKISGIIQDKKIIPVPKWHFVLKNIATWGLFVVFIFFSSLISGVILFILVTYDWEVHAFLGRTLFTHIIISIPYFLIFILGALILAAYYIFHFTKRGYMHTLFRILIISGVASFILGACLFICNINSKTHEVFSRNIPFYDDLIYYKEDIWNNPERGLLGGEVVDVQCCGVESCDEFILNDFQGNTWRVKGEQIAWPEGLTPYPGLRVKLAGDCHSEEDDGVFYGRSIWPW